ncbi:MAG: deoxyribonuclease IV [Acidobacteria bacterium]|nr:deoxyribonuclease IV [Acidobacteriota bacterium]
MGKRADLLGAHISTAGAIELAPGRAARLGIRAMQVFTSNQLQWNQKQITASNAASFRDRMRAHGVEFVCSHASYLINLASPSPILRRKSQAAMSAELQRCRDLGIPFLVFHPGAHLGSGEDKGLARVVDAMNRLSKGNGEIPALTVEITAGQGTCLGASFDHLAEIVRSVRSGVRICIDTCHLLAAGYELRDEASYGRTFDALERAVGLHRIAVFHFNDSKGDLGCRLDRHEHIGKGRIGLATFHRLMDDDRFRRMPMILETPEGEAKDPMNLRKLRARRRSP